MPGALTHSPADVLRWLLIDLGQGSDPADGAAWPVFASAEPDSPDSCLTVYDTAGRDSGRSHPDGERAEHHGVQVRVRATSHREGYQKARAIALALDQDVYRDTVVIGDDAYRVWSVSRTGDVLVLGTNIPGSKRHLFTVNAVVSLRQLQLE